LLSINDMNLDSEKKAELLGLLNTKYIVVQEENLEKQPIESFELVFEESGKRVYLNTMNMPRAFIVGEVKKIEDRQNIMNELKKDSFDPKKTVFVEKGTEFQEGSEFKEAKIKYYSPDKIILNVEIEKNGFLFLSETFYPGWKASDNGKEKKIFRTNYIFRGISLEPGKHEIEFVFEPESYEIGKLISLVSLLLVVLGFIIPELKPKLDQIKQLD
jgi:uncharacterized membrane protein YfhO